ncbi:MAG: nucleotidyl transferase AbiEii/AbiGii toxin family protein [Prevotella sp.]|nr:nucleotidyl transferase AbiEii/AbiGii toxin family protein [Prevotella sp.]
MQRITLSGLYRAGFFEHAAFYGGTCLRIFHNLRRFSEDMDFTLTEKNPNIHLEDCFPQIIEAFKLTGRDVTIKKKDKKTFGKVESAFLKDNTDVNSLPLMAVTGHNYVKKSGMSPIPRLIIIGVTEPLMHLKNCAQRN